MTLLGKILVLVNVLFSFVLFSWALAVYTNRIDWSANPPKEGKPAGVLKGRQDLVKAHYDALNLADARWRAARNGPDALLAQEKRRVDDSAWYAVELRSLRDGPGGNVKAAVSWVKTKDGQPALDAAGRPTLEPAARRKLKPEDAPQALFSERYYNDMLAQLTQQIEAEQVRYQDLVKQDTELSEKAIGPKGLRQRIIDEQGKSARMDDELKDVAGRRTNNLVDAELLQSRRDQLERRVEELKKK
jgi:hypothetical protein